MGESSPGRGRIRTIGELKLKEAVIIKPQTSVFEAVKMMAAKNIDSALIVDESGDGVTPDVLRRTQISGILTSKDIINKVLAKGLDLSKTQVSSVMTKPVKSVEDNASLYKVASFMNNNDYRQMPVVDKGGIKGMITMRNVNMSIISGILEDIKLMASIFR